MNLEWQIAVAFLLDLLFGDPRWLPHPVKLIGWLAARLENPLRQLAPSARVAGVLVVLLVLGLTGGVTWLLVAGSRLIHPLVGDLVSILLLYTTLAARDLAEHAHNVLEALRADNLAEARRLVGRMVGRDTDCLDQTGVARAAVESVAENLVDGVIAPIFFAFLGGPIAAMLFKAASTLDSTFGYRDERYAEFGWASARLDDAANYIPARLAVPLLALAAGLAGGRMFHTFAIARRDGRNHPSPNAGLGEAAMAGALGIQLGGMSHYGGEPSPKPTLGDPIEALQTEHIREAYRLMLICSAIALLAFADLRWTLYLLWMTL